MLICNSSDIFYSNGGYGDSVIHPSYLLPPNTFQMFKTKHSISTSGAGPSLLFDRVCCKDGKIILYDKDVSKGNQVQKVDEILLRPHS